MAILTPLPFADKLSQSNGRTLNQSVINSELGGVLTYRNQNGVNSRYDTWTIKWNNLTTSEKVQIEQFWDAHGKTSSFAFTDTNSDTIACVFISDLSFSATSGDTYNAECSIQQVFDFISSVVFPTPTPTISLTPSITVTPTLTPSITPTMTRTATVTPSVTASLTPSPTATMTATPTPTATQTPSVTPTISVTPSVTVTPGLSKTPTPTVSLTPSITPSITPTLTRTATVTPSVTATVTPTVSVTASVTPTRTPTQTQTPTPTATMTPTPSITPSNTPIPLQAFVGGEQIGMMRINLDNKMVTHNDISNWLNPNVTDNGQPHGEGVICIVTNTSGTFAYNQYGNYIGVVNVDTNTMLASINMGVPVGYMAYASTQNELWVLSTDGNTLFVINCTTNTIANTISLSSESADGAAVGLKYFKSSNRVIFARVGSFQFYNAATKARLGRFTAYNNNLALDDDETGSYVYLASNNGTDNVIHRFTASAAALQATVIYFGGSTSYVTQLQCMNGYAYTSIPGPNRVDKHDMFNGTASTSIGLNTVKLIGKNAATNLLYLRARDGADSRLYELNPVTDSFNTTTTLNSNYGASWPWTFATFRRPIPAPSSTPTMTPSATRTMTPTPSVTMTMTPSVTRTPTPTGTRTPTPTASVTPSITPSTSPAAIILTDAFAVYSSANRFGYVATKGSPNVSFSLINNASLATGSGTVVAVETSGFYIEARREGTDIFIRRMNALTNGISEEISVSATPYSSVSGMAYNPSSDTVAILFNGGVTQSFVRVVDAMDLSTVWEVELAEDATKIFYSRKTNAFHLINGAVVKTVTSSGATTLFTFTNPITGEITVNYDGDLVAYIPQLGQIHRIIIPTGTSNYNIPVVSTSDTPNKLLAVNTTSDVEYWFYTSRTNQRFYQAAETDTAFTQISLGTNRPALGLAYDYVGASYLGGRVRNGGVIILSTDTNGFRAFRRYNVSSGLLEPYVSIGTSGNPLVVGVSILNPINDGLAPTPTPTPTISVTPTRTVTPTVSFSPTPTPTVTPSSSPLLNSCVSVPTSFTSIGPVSWSPELGLFSIIGSGVAGYSDDGFTWNTGTITNSSNINQRCSAYSSSLQRTVAVGSVGVGVTVVTNDGVNWTEYATGVGAFNSITWSDTHSKFVATRSDGAYTSSDGMTWAGPNTMPSGTNSAIYWSADKGLYVSVGSSGVAYSSNGTSWTAGTINTGSGISLDPDAIAYSPTLGMFIAIANSEGVYLTSTNGTSWTRRTYTNGPNGYAKCVLWIPEFNRFVRDGYHSLNGINWVSTTSIQMGTSAAWSPELGILTGVVDGQLRTCSVVDMFPSPTPTATLTPTPTPTSSITPSVTPTTSVTPSITPSVTRTSSMTPTPTISQSATPMMTPTPTMTNTPTSSVTPTATLTPTPTPSVTPSLSASPAPLVQITADQSIINESSIYPAPCFVVINYQALYGITPYSFAGEVIFSNDAENITVSFDDGDNPDEYKCTVSVSEIGHYEVVPRVTVTDDLGNSALWDVSIVFDIYASAPPTPSPTPTPTQTPTASG